MSVKGRKLSVKLLMWELLLISVKGAKIGNDVKIYPQVYIGEGVVIGDHTTIYAGAKIYYGCVIGSGCTIHAGTVIGTRRWFWFCSQWG